MNGGSGRCLCGATTFAFDGAPLWQGHCHCESCRRATASPMTSFLGVANGRWRWTGATPAVYASSPGVERTFCGTCGAPMSFRADRYPDEIHFYAATLDDPAGYEPTVHFHHDERLPWLHLDDDLERREGPAS